MGVELVTKKVLSFYGDIMHRKILSPVQTTMYGTEIRKKILLGTSLYVDIDIEKLVFISIHCVVCSCVFFFQRIHFHEVSCCCMPFYSIRSFR